ncbi:MAG: hypothetical protein JKY30_06270 [Flavobacteriales bacterium]|nr:hypothetical protein [Flavobacteriales bacterium]
MKNIKLLVLGTFISVISLNGYSQTDLSELDRPECGAAIINNQRLAEDPKLQLIFEAHNKLAIENEKNMVNTTNKKGPILYTIPVVYHIIHDEGVGNVSKAAINASVKNLNDDFQKLNTDVSQVVSAFTGIIADCQIQFRLAHIDPNGNCTEGITRTSSPLTNSAGENVKSLVNWNTTKYLNIWVVQTLTSGAGGYAYYPGFAPSQSAEGIVIRSSQLGNSVTHEVGHYLNLPHCWGNSNTPGLASNCNGDDGVNDTPETIGNQTCNTSAVSCSSLDNVQNYMEYSFCERMFTNGQKSRMHTALGQGWGSRNTLWTSGNLVATGTADPYTDAICVPIPDFDFDRDFICQGQSVLFTDLSYNATPTIWNWTFGGGGTPNTSTASSPTIVFNNPGVWNTTHEPGTTAGSALITKPNIITVSSLTADYGGIIVDGFENSTNFNNDWIILDPTGGQAFQRTTAAAATGSASTRVVNYSEPDAGEIDELISPSYDLSLLSGATLKFKMAFAQRQSSNTDRLFVYYSLDCGESWSFVMAPMIGGQCRQQEACLSQTSGLQQVVIGLKKRQV